MNTDNQPTPDDAFRDAWQRAFEKASETPPPRVWKAIERQLDAGDRARIIPFWTQARPWLTGAAAAVALLLVGWWAAHQFSNTPATASLNTRTTPPATRTEALTKSNGPSASDLATAMRPTRSGADTQKRGPTRRMAESVPPNVPADLLLAKGEPDVTRIQPPVSAESGQMSPSGISRLTSVRPTDAFGNRLDVTHQLTVNILITTDSGAVSPPGRHDLPPLFDPLATNGQERASLAIGKLTGKPFRTHPLAIQRVVWFRNDDPLATESATSTPGTRETWASLSLLPASFDPATAARYGFNLAPASNAYSSAIAAPVTSSSGFTSQAGSSVTVQAGAGRQLTDRWSVEAGVGYLQAYSTVISPVQTPVYANAAAKTLYATTLENAISKSAFSYQSDPISGADKGSLAPTPAYITGRQEQVRNDYTYIQVPVQVGYQLRPRRRLGLSVLGGLLTNWFVRNSVGEGLVVKPGDGIFRPVTLAGTAGVRFRYRSSRRWSASLAGVYQQALQSGTLSDVNLITRPRSIGVSVGMDYHF